MTRIRPAEHADAARICAIYNQGIAERSATFETKPRERADITARIADSARYPMLVAVDINDEVLGWAGLSVYRERACYAGIAEFSIYFDRQARGQGLGRHLLQSLILVAANQGYWKLLSRVFLFNQASRALCRACGFREVGVYERHAQLDGQWLDVVIVERCLLPTDAPLPEPHPVG
ncbi:GNAT family N-acetyltransferase [Ahniella affigens]|uniref:GNAT family N-acetyltransferase n=1 Tax=Ahniella affigens TaxID=2021234 RepID=A0A2P1PN43_9GAMM|nr:arsinothricin resistance N-acetyltransferase ArsN1 family A [Ahniella affigens]AVP96248.1 GNAT family N-acetyltransferase [Ahniella affigens]